MECGFRISLQQMAMVKFVVSLWERNEVQDKLRRYFSNNDILFRRSMPTWCYGSRILENINMIKDEFNDIIYSVMIDAKEIVLPLSLQPKLMYIIRDMGKKIHCWYLHMKFTWRTCKICNGGRDYVEKIYWTQYGTIDEVKIFKSFCVGHPKFNISEIHNTVCSDFEKECKELSDLCFRQRSTLDLHSYIRYVTYLQLYRAGDTVGLKDYLDMLVRNVNGPARAMLNDPERLQIESRYENAALLNLYMLLISLVEGKSIAVAYFWGQINHPERSDNLIIRFTAKYAVLFYIFQGSFRMNVSDEFKYLKEHYVRIFMFVYHQMTEADKHKFYSYSTNINMYVFYMLLTEWPWQDHLSSIFREMVPYVQNFIAVLFLDYFERKFLLHCDPGHGTAHRYFKSVFNTAVNMLPGTLRGRYAYVDFHGDVEADRFVRELLMETF
uniref:Uncharacterized protein n=1 Tax=Clastoptera arizonana TaxID=38151 RepID=A0A1B6DT27_9HEMI